jgi:excisionase family DNA binding protein
MKNMILEELIDINEVARLFGLSISTLRKMCMRKQIPHHKFGRKVLFYKPEIAKWIMANKAA